MNLSDIQPANPEEVKAYNPYYPVGRRPHLPLALGLYRQKSFEGHRQVEGEDAIPFVATWPLQPLPSDLTRCQVQFERDAELTYELSLSNYEFIDFLIDVVSQLERSQQADFNKTFYRKLMRRDDGGK
ncbi:MAG: type IV pilus biogenesis protein EbsA [Cyanobacteria bacterium J06642_2]